jgi:pilus assembly protein CpaE
MENDEINVEDVEEVLNKKLYWKIPNNYFTMMSAINKGVPVSLINSESNVALSYKNLALLVSDSIYRRQG